MSADLKWRKEGTELWAPVPGAFMVVFRDDLVPGRRWQVYAQFATFRAWRATYGSLREAKAAAARDAASMWAWAPAVFAATGMR